MALIAAAAPTAESSNIEDAAELAFALGYHDMARRLWETAFVIEGFSPARRNRHRLIAAETECWDVATWSPTGPTPVPSGAATGMTLAIEQVRHLGTLPFSSRIPEPPTPVIDVLAVPDRREWYAGEVTGAARDLASQLFVALQSGRVDLLGDVLDGLIPLIVALPLKAADVDLEVDLEGVADITIAVRLQAFLHRTQILFASEIGSPALFAVAACLADNGLGPYLDAVRYVVRQTSDVFGLARLASPDGFYDQAWLVALASNLDRDTLHQLADEAGDHGLMTVLAGLLHADRRCRDDDAGLIRIVRDAALDNGDLGLAVDAQSALTQLRVVDPIEWLALGEVIATSGDTVRAEEALRRGQEIAPSNALIAERLAALTGSGFDAYATRNGFGSPPWRVALRRRNLRSPDTE